jgi:hypothetical protein
MLDIFAFHIRHLAYAKPGESFGLSFWGNVYIDVHVDNCGLFFFREQGKPARCVGNSYGASKAYADLCAQAFDAKENN